MIIKYVILFIAIVFVPCFSMQPESKESGCIQQMWHWILDLSPSFTYQIQHDDQSDYNKVVYVAPSWGGSTPTVIYVRKNKN